MAPAPPPPLPVADNYASLTNRISLSIASRSSVLKSMNQSKSQPVRRRVIPDDNDEDLTRSTQPNTGVGYVPEKKDVEKYANSKEERMLRGRMGKGATGKGKKMVEESESEEDVGRSALGKRKRSRKEAVEPEPEPELEKQTLPTTTPESDKNGDGAEADVEMKDSVTKEESTNLEGTADKKRKKKNKKKNKKQKTGNVEAGAEA